MTFVESLRYWNAYRQEISDATQLRQTTMIGYVTHSKRTIRIGYATQPRRRIQIGHTRELKRTIERTMAEANAVQIAPETHVMLTEVDLAVPECAKIFKCLGNSPLGKTLPKFANSAESIPREFSRELRPRFLVMSRDLHTRGWFDVG